MILNKGRYQIAQITGSNTVTIFLRGNKKPYKVLPAREGLSVAELEKVLDLYTKQEANNEGDG